LTQKIDGKRVTCWLEIGGEIVVVKGRALALVIAGGVMLLIWWC